MAGGFLDGPPPDDGMAPEEAFPGRRVYAIWAKRGTRKLWRVLDGRSRLICLIVGIPFVFAVSFGAAGIVSAERAEPVNAQLLAEAKSLDLDYLTVASSPHLYAGKPVLWCLVQEEAGGVQRLLVDGNRSQEVRMQGGDFTVVYTGRMGRCKRTLGVVEKGPELGVFLRFAGHP